MHAAFQLPFSGRCSRQVYGTVTSLKECGSVLNSRLWGRALREDRKNGCEADYAFGKLVIMSLVPEKSVGMPNTHSKIHSTTNGRPIQYHHLTYLQSSLTISLWWRVGCDGKEESEADRWPSFSLHPSHHPLLPPCVTCEDYWEQVSIITQIYYEVHFFWAQYLQVYLHLG